VRLRLLDDAGQEAGPGSVGRVSVRSAWTSNKTAWIETGDLARRDSDGDCFLCGRIDDMIVSGGENVFPLDLENALLQHPDVAAAAVVGIADAEFGLRLKAVVVRRTGSGVGATMLLEWLVPRVARHQMPCVIEFRSDLPYTAVGKPDKNALRAESADS
jgi:acyl-CoA synthetase (AMP-forming)/AMP-acid ligase II